MQLASSFKGQALCAPAPLRAFVPFVPKRLTCRAEERLRLHNLSPAKGSRRQEKRKGRGHAAGQGGTCGFGNRGQKSRSGPGVRPGFEGGQTPLYRRLPKLRGIAGGMSAGISKHVVVNLDDLEKTFEENAVVTLDELKKKNLLNVSGRSADLPLKVLGTGTLSKPLVIKAAKFSSSALEKIQSAGGSVEVIPGKEKWTRKAHEQKVKEFAEKGLDYHKEMAKKRAAAAKAKAKKSVKS